MNTIWKFQLDLGVQTLSMPAHAKILHIDNQSETLCMWVLLDTSHSFVPRTFEVHGTGIPVMDQPGSELKYLGTALFGRYVWHVFERVSVAS